MLFQSTLKDEFHSFVDSGPHENVKTPGKHLPAKSMVSKYKERKKISADADGGPMGVPVSAQRDTQLIPPSTSAEIFQHTCLQSSLKKNLKVKGGKIFKKKF
jgi:hypothetical protein